MKPSLLLCLGALLAACETSPPAAPSAPATAAPAASTAAPVHEHNALAPLVVRVRGPASVQPHERISLQLSLERRQLNRVPIQLSLQLPPGVTLVEGALDEQIVDDRDLTISRTVTLSVGEVPATDVVVSATVRGSNYGAHASDRYRFGRPEPRLPQPYDRAVKLPGLPGASIPIGPR